MVGKINWSITCFLSEMGSCLSWSISSFFSKTASRCSDSGIYFFFSGVFQACGLSEVFEFCHFFQFFADLLVCLRCPHGLSCTLSILCVFLSQLSGFLSLNCPGVFPFVLLFR